MDHELIIAEVSDGHTMGGVSSLLKKKSSSIHSIFATKCFPPTNG